MLRQRDRRRLEAMLQHDAERHAGGATGRDQLLRTRGGDVERLFQQDVLAGPGAEPGDVEMRVGRRQHQHRLDGLVRQQRFQIVAEREGEARAEGCPPFGAGAVGADDLDPVGEVDEAPGMGRHGHAEHDDPDAQPAHALTPLFRGRASAAAPASARVLQGLGTVTGARPMGRSARTRSTIRALPMGAVVRDHHARRWSQCANGQAHPSTAAGRARSRPADAAMDPGQTKTLQAGGLQGFRKWWARQGSNL